MITAVGGEGALRQHFLDMGVIPGVEVTLVKYAPMGDPMELRIHGYELTLRLADAEKIEITEAAAMRNQKQAYGEAAAGAQSRQERRGWRRQESDAAARGALTEHPGLGEEGR